MVTHSAQGSIEGMLVSSAVWGPKVPKCHGLLKGFRKSASRKCHRRRFLLAGAVELRQRCPPRGVLAKQQAPTRRFLWEDRPWGAAGAGWAGAHCPSWLLCYCLSLGGTRLILSVPVGIDIH